MNASVLIDIPSLIFVSSALWVGLFVGAKDIHRTVSLSQDLVLPMGMTASLIGLIRILSDLNDLSQLLPALAVAVLPLFYSGILFVLLDVLRTRSWKDSTSEVCSGSAASCRLEAKT